MNIQKELLQEAVAVSGATSQTMAVIWGLRELIRQKRLEKLASFMGSDLIKLNAKDLKRMRQR